MKHSHVPSWLAALWLLAGLAAWAPARAETVSVPGLPSQPSSQPSPLAVTTLLVQAAPEPLPALDCPAPPRPRPVPRPPAQPGAGGPQEHEGAREPTELPAEAEVARALADPSAPGPVSATATRISVRPAPHAPLRMAVWGDSHMAAGFFTEELSRLAGVRDTLAQPRLLPAGFGHGGVRGLVRRVCVSGPWIRESAHASPTAAQRPGPGLVSLVNTAPGAALAWDLRDGNGEPRHGRIRLLLAPSAGRVTLEVAADAQAPRSVPVGPTASGALLELTAAQGALSLLRVRVLEGTLRLQGLQLGEAPTPPEPLQIDLYGYPGATVAGWALADPDAHAVWFGERRYDLVVLAYGTNEAHDTAFRAEEYRLQLARAVTRLRERFPEAQCLLIAPGDRGVRVARQRGPARSRPDLLRYARLHAQVAAIQRDVAQAAGCAAWNMQAAMGGAGSAYRWARQQPAWMAPDLIHFTPAGYRELARRLGAELGWVAP